MSFRLVIVLTFIFQCSLLSAELYCKDENGENVDWFIVYKLPKMNQRKNSHFADGLKYAYISGPPINGKEAVNGWKLSEKMVSDVNSIFGKTLAPVYQNPYSYTSIQYNDDAPNGNGSKYWAHAKGILAMDSNTGFWLIHSIPKFPPTFTGQYDYPASAAINGQIALCISVGTDEMADNILNHLLIMRPHIYHSFENADVLKVNLTFKNLVEKKASKDSFDQFTIRSINGVVFNSYSKSSKTEEDLYKKSIGPDFESNLLVQTWRKGSGGPLPSNCEGDYSVENIDALELQFNDRSIPSSGQWSYTNDHAKWAVSDNKNLPYTCIGDLNRMISQFKRGGGAVCMRDPEVWKHFRNSIRSIEKCKKHDEL